MLKNLQRPRRYPLLLPLRVWIRSWGKSRSTTPDPMAEETITANISSVGCYFQLSKAPPVGSAVEMEIAMAPETGKAPGSRVVAVGTVVRVEKQPAGRAGVACEFDRTKLLPTPTKP